jgi:hypothetical protein
MDPVFTLPYSEYAAISVLSRIFPKKHYAILVPTSRQQKGVDLVVMKVGTRRVLRVQVKSSRAYESVPKPNARKKIPGPAMTFWFGNFLRKYRRGVADLYLFLGVYPSYSVTKPVSREAWRTIFLAMKDNEMGTFLRSVRTTKGRADKFFYVGFDPPSRGAVKKIMWTRGALKGTSCARFLLDGRREEVFLRMLP